MMEEGETAGAAKEEVMEAQSLAMEEPSLEEEQYTYEDMNMEEPSERSGARISRRRLNVTAESAPFDISYHPGRVLLYSPPRQRQRWGDTQVLPRVNWGDLFFDLFYVAATYNVSYILVESPNKEGLLYAAGTFLPIMGIWSQKMFYDSRYVTESDIYHRLWNLILLVVLGVAVLHIRPANELSNASQNPSMFAFSLMLVVERLLVVLLYFEVYVAGVGQPANKPASLRDMRLQTLCLPFYIASLAVSAREYFGGGGHDASRLLAEESASGASYAETTNVPIYLCLSGYIVMLVLTGMNVVFCFPKAGEHKEISVPMNIDFAIHRTGEWTMLMLGESVFSLLTVDVANEGNSFYTVFYTGILTVIFLQLLHFRSQPHDADSHALRRSKNAGVVWNFLQHVYSLALVVLGAAFTYFLLLSDEKEGRRLTERWLAGGIKSYTQTEVQAAAHLFSGALAIIFFSLDGMSVMHLGFEESQCRCTLGETKKKKNYKGMVVVAVHVGFIAFAATLSQWQTDPVNLSIIGLCCVFAQVTMRKFGSMYLSKKKSVSRHHVHDKRVPLSDSETGDANVTHARAEPAEDTVAS